MKILALVTSGRPESRRESGEQGREARESDSGQPARREPTARELLIRGGHRTEADLYRSLALVSQLGLVVVFSVLIGLLGGWSADRWLGSSGIMTGLGVLLGVAGGFAGVVHLLYRETELTMRGEAKNGGEHG